MWCVNQLENYLHKKGKKRPATTQAPKDNAKEESSGVNLNGAALGCVIAEALKGSFEGLRDSMNAGFPGLGNLIASYSGDNSDEDSGYDCDSSVSKDDDQSLVADEPPARNTNRMNRERTAIPRLLSSQKPYSSPRTWGPPSTGSRRRLWIKSWERKQITESHVMPIECVFDNMGTETKQQK